MIRRRLLAACTLVVVLAGCGTAVPAGGPAPAEGCVADFAEGVDYYPDKVAPSESTLWDISYHGGYKVLTVPNVEFPGHPDLRYVLHRCGTPAPEPTGDLAGAQVFETPVRRTMVEHANSFAMLDALGVNATVVGMSSPLLRNREDPWWAGAIARIGAEPADIGGTADGTDFDHETMLALGADLMVNGGYGPSYTYNAQQVRAGIPAVLGANRMEPTPLGSAEWVKYFSAFFDAEARGTQVFEEIAARYRETAEQVAGVVADRRVGYLCMAADQGCEFVYAHGDRSLNGRIIAELGATNVFAPGNDAPNGQNYDFERAVLDAGDADFFVVYDEPDAVTATLADPRFQALRPFATGAYATRVPGSRAACQATSYLHVEVLVQDVAQALEPGLFPGRAPHCFGRAAPPA
jgi:iron complex transport system substrate-binding protein